MILLIIVAKGIEIDKDSTHYDHHQGIGIIIQDYDYVHLHVNTTTLKHTYNHIIDSYNTPSSQLKLKSRIYHRPTWNQIY